MDFKEHYKIDAELFDYFGADQLSQNERRRNYYVLKHFPAHKGEKILEIGSGRGWFSLAMAKKGFDITAVDLSQKNLDLIKEKSSFVKTKFGSADDLPFTEERFDWIVMNEVLEHLEHPSLVIEHIKSFLTLQGKIFISVPYKENIVQELCIHCHKMTPHSAHLHSFTKKSLERLATDNNLFVINQFTYLHKLFTKTGLISLVKLIPNCLFEVKDQFLCTLNDKAEYISLILMKKG
jgi:2-polyprenyl-3-methyl-5-hydroxy-6-metoxy-1,4-benzoquinol methylase